MSAARHELSDEQRRRLRRRAVPALGGGLLFVLIVALILGSGTSEQAGGAQRFADAWKRGDYAAMYEMLSSGAKERTSRPAFERAYKMAAATATTVSLGPGKPHDASGGARVPVTVATRIFGTLRGRLLLPVDGDDHVDWRPNLVFPGLAKGAALTTFSTGFSTGDAARTSVCKFFHGLTDSLFGYKGGI